MVPATKGEIPVHDTRRFSDVGDPSQRFSGAEKKFPLGHRFLYGYASLLHTEVPYSMESTRKVERIRYLAVKTT